MKKRKKTREKTKNGSRGRSLEETILDFKYYKLGNLEKETIVEVDISCAANVCLMDGCNFRRYKAGNCFRYYGGYMTYSPCSFTIPNYDAWYIVIDFGGEGGYIMSSVEVHIPVYESDYEPINWQKQSEDEDYMVKVSSRYFEKNPQYGTPRQHRTDFLVFDKKTGKHKHISVDNEGGNLTDWHPWK